MSSGYKEPVTDVKQENNMNKKQQFLRQWTSDNKAKWSLRDMKQM